MGLARTSTRITIDVTDKVGVIADIGAMFRDNNINIISIVAKPETSVKTELTIRAELGGKGLEIIEQLREAGYYVTRYQQRKKQGVNMESKSFKVGDIVKMKKPHPCGSYEWEILRTGMDFGIKCCGCGHFVMLARPKFEKGREGCCYPRFGKIN